MHWYLLVLLQQIKDAVNPKPRTAGKDRVPPAQWFVSMQGVEFLHDFVLFECSIRGSSITCYEVGHVPQTSYSTSFSLTQTETCMRKV